MLQLDLSTVNGISTITSNFNSAKIAADRSIIRRSSIPIATIFLQTMHEDSTGNLLIDGEQELVINYLQVLLETSIENANKNYSQTSLTFVHFYE